MLQVTSFPFELAEGQVPGLTWDRLDLIAHTVDEVDGIALVTFGETKWYVTYGDSDGGLVFHFVEVTVDAQPESLRLWTWDEQPEEDFVLRRTVVPTV